MTTPIYRGILLFVILLSALSKADELPLSQALYNKIQKHNKHDGLRDIRTVDAAIEQLPLVLRKNWTAQYDPKGLQEGSYQSPRIIMFGGDGESVVTFNGDPKQEGYYRLEFAQEDPVSHQPVLTYLEFPADGKGDVRLSSGNPSECTGCHGDKPNWKWTNYPHWHGAYGSDDDGIHANNEEGKHFISFVDGMKKRDRYRWLVAGEQRHAPYHDGTEALLHRSRMGLFPDKLKEHFLNSVKVRSPATMPNSRLTDYIVQRQVRRLTTLISHDEALSRLLPALLYFEKCADTNEIANWFLPRLTGEPLDEEEEFIELAPIIVESIRARIRGLEGAGENVSVGALYEFDTQFISQVYADLREENEAFRKLGKPATLKDYIRENQTDAGLALYTGKNADHMAALESIAPVYELTGLGFSLSLNSTECQWLKERAKKAFHRRPPLSHVMPYRKRSPRHD